MVLGVRVVGLSYCCWALAEASVLQVSKYVPWVRGLGLSLNLIPFNMGSIRFVH
jgi:hypothetical protein